MQLFHMDSSNDKAVILKMHMMRLDKIILYNAKKEEILIGYFLKCDFKYLISSISLLSHLSLDRLLEKTGNGHIHGGLILRFTW